MNMNTILVINGGSSSIKFALFVPGKEMTAGLHGEIENIGTDHAELHFKDPATGVLQSISVNAGDPENAANALIGWLKQQAVLSSITAIGHRIVHGMKHTEPELITPGLLDELRQISTYDPGHLPGEIKYIEAFQKSHPPFVQVACFDTAFHTTMPTVAKIMAIPRRFTDKGVQRYGFHGISYAFLIEELGRVAGPEAANGKVILAHLGSGASLAAVKNGKSMDTSMGFTPAAGILMGTRSGDLDPGVAWYMMQSENMDAGSFNQVINHDSGLLGASGTSADMRELLKTQAFDVRAAEAVNLFCYQAKKWIGSYAAVLGGVDTLIFAGGIGENAPEIRSRICRGLGFLGIELDENANGSNGAIISSATSTSTVRVIPTNEELMIAKMVAHLLNANQ